MAATAADEVNLRQAAAFEEQHDQVIGGREPGDPQDVDSVAEQLAGLGLGVQRGALPEKRGAGRLQRP